MASNIKDGSNYLDGVPVKISSKFLPPNPVTIPLALDTKYSTDVLLEQYDFSLERKVLEHNKRRLLELEAAKTKTRSPPKPTNADTDPQPPKEASRKGVQCPWSSNTILQPSPQQPLGKTPSCANAKSNDTKINLSDFENDTSSPFDYMELQTINDLEELNSVFQGINGKKDQQEQQQEEPSKDVSSSEEMSVAKSVSFPLPQNPWPEKIPNSHSENFASDLGRTSQDFASSLPNDPPGLSTEGHQQFDRFEAGAGHSNNRPPQFESRSNNGPSQFDRFGAGASQSKNGPSQFESCSNNGPPQFESHSNSGPSPFDRFEAVVGQSNNGPPQFESGSYNGHSQFDRFVSKGHPQYPSSLGPCDTVGYSTLSQVPYITSNAGAPMVQGSSLRGSKSFSDISRLSDVEIMNSARGRSRTPPSYCPVTKPVAHESLSLQEDHFKDESSNGGSSAYDELDETSRRFVDSLTEMGFPQGQVSRAVKHLGADEKKVVEHLCQIQALEESGYDSSEAEAALHLHDYNRDQAKEFLDLVNQFQDLGFEKDAIKKALVQNKNDWNKTIDALLP